MHCCSADNYGIEDQVQFQARGDIFRVAMALRRSLEPPST
jgi:hypothetical protein